MDRNQAITLFNQHAATFPMHGVHLQPSVKTYLADEFRFNYDLAQDAQPLLFTDPNAAIPAFLTTSIDPTVFRIVFTPSKASLIFGEVQKGTWLDQTIMFPIAEYVGEVSSYGDYAENGLVSANINFPQRQNYLYQCIKEYGDLEADRAGLVKLNWSAELDASAALVMQKFQNTSYFFGIGGLQNYGMLNDPNLAAALTPSTKAAGGTKWVNNGIIVATANEIFADIQALFMQVVKQSAGILNQDTPFILALSPQSRMALTATNSFNVNVSDLLRKNFPNLTIVDAVQYGSTTTANPQGNVAGELIQLIADNVEGQDVGYMAYSDKMRAHPMVRALSSWKQKITAGTWGAIVRFPAGIAQMVGV